VQKRFDWLVGPRWLVVGQAPTGIYSVTERPPAVSPWFVLLDHVYGEIWRQVGDRGGTNGLLSRRVGLCVDGIGGAHGEGDYGVALWRGIPGWHLRALGNRWYRKSERSIDLNWRGPDDPDTQPDTPCGTSPRLARRHATETCLLTMATTLILGP
jgi:hypothetical protein